MSARPYFGFHSLAIRWRRSDLSGRHLGGGCRNPIAELRTKAQAWSDDAISRVIVSPLTSLRANSRASTLRHFMT